MTPAASATWECVRQSHKATTLRANGLDRGIGGRSLVPGPGIPSQARPKSRVAVCGRTGRRERAHAASSPTPRPHLRLKHGLDLVERAAGARRWGRRQPRRVGLRATKSVALVGHKWRRATRQMPIWWQNAPRVMHAKSTRQRLGRRRRRATPLGVRPQARDGSHCRQMPKILAALPPTTFLASSSPSASNTAVTELRV